MKQFWILFLACGWVAVRREFTAATADCIPTGANYGWLDCCAAEFKLGMSP